MFGRKPWKIRRNGDVFDRSSGDCIGRVNRFEVDLGKGPEIVFEPMVGIAGRLLEFPGGALFTTRKEAAYALYRVVVRDGNPYGE